MSALDQHGIGARIDRALRLARHAVDELETVSAAIQPEALVWCPACGGDRDAFAKEVRGSRIVELRCAGCGGTGTVPASKAAALRALAAAAAQDPWGDMPCTISAGSADGRTLLRPLPISANVGETTDGAAGPAEDLRQAAP